MLADVYSVCTNAPRMVFPFLSVCARPLCGCGSPLSRFNDFYTRYTTLVASTPSTTTSAAATTTAAASTATAGGSSAALRRGPAAGTATSSTYTYTPYVPLSRRRPISELGDLGEKSRELGTGAKAGAGERHSTLGIPAVGVTVTSPTATGTGQRRSSQRPYHIYLYMYQLTWIVLVSFLPIGCAFVGWTVVWASQPHEQAAIISAKQLPIKICKLII